jgi:hypothetical protein
VDRRHPVVRGEHEQPVERVDRGARREGPDRPRCARPAEREPRRARRARAAARARAGAGREGVGEPGRPSPMTMPGSCPVSASAARPARAPPPRRRPSPRRRAPARASRGPPAVRARAGGRGPRGLRAAVVRGAPGTGPNLLRRGEKDARGGGRRK